MSYACFPRSRLMRIMPRAAGPIRELVPLRGRMFRIPIVPGRGILVVAPGTRAYRPEDLR